MSLCAGCLLVGAKINIRLEANPAHAKSRRKDSHGVLCSTLENKLSTKA